MTANGSKPAILGWMLSAVLVGGLALGTPARGDVLILKDGRQFQGNIISATDTRVTIDTKIENVRVIIGFNMDETAKVQRKALPAGFFDPPPPASRISDPSKFKAGQPLYLEVSLTGIPGKDYFAMALDRVLSYANSNRITHVVLTIDSTGRNPDEANAIFNILKNGKKKVLLHGLIRNCNGAALAAVFWCDSIHLLPGGKLGGPLPDEGPAASPEEAQDQEVIWASIADRVIRETGRKGTAAEIIRAMIDPEIQLAVWKDTDGQNQAGVEPPAGLPKDKVILSSKKGERLSIDYDQAVALGMKPYDGGAEGLGGILGLTGWAKESDYGEKAISFIAKEKMQLADAKAKKEVRAQAAFEEKVEKNVTRREESLAYIQNCIQQAKEFDPSKGSYQAYADTWNWGWSWGGNPERWTKESQERWTDRTDATMHYLAEAAKGLKSLKRLDEEAVKLGVEPTLKPGDAVKFIKDLEGKYNALAADRDRNSAK